jgi:hypothetical protein
MLEATHFFRIDALVDQPKEDYNSAYTKKATWSCVLFSARHS